MVFDLQKQTDLSGIDDAEILADSFTDEIEGLTPEQLIM